MARTERIHIRVTPEFKKVIKEITTGDQAHYYKGWSEADVLHQALYNLVGNIWIGNYATIESLNQRDKQNDY